MPNVPASDEDFDYVWTTALAIQPGGEYVRGRESLGVVQSGTEGVGYWNYTVVVTLPDGTETSDIFSWYSPELNTNPDFRIRVWRQVPKPAFGTILGLIDGVTDGSEWIYPGNAEGTYFCYLGGTEATAGTFAHRALIPGLESVEYEPIGTAEYDWAYVDDGAQVQVGETIIWDILQRVTVTEILPVDLPTGIRQLIIFCEDAVVVYAFEGDQDYATGGRNDFYHAIPKPDWRAKFVARDGSKWIYPPNEAGTFLCWSPGTQYVAGAEFLRANIAGGLRPAE